MPSTRLVSDAVDVRRFLVSCVGRDDKSLPTYGEVADVCGRVAPGLGGLLDYIYEQCQDRGEPDITALVVNQQTRTPGKFGGRYAVDGRLDLDAWRAELARVRAHDWADTATRSAPSP